MDPTVNNVAIVHLFNHINIYSYMCNIGAVAEGFV